MITIVSGLPRSGTSMMMQMLHAGGMPVLADETRPADARNPNGFFESDLVHQWVSDPSKSWSDAADGRAVKVLSALLPQLPSTHDYRVIVMRRPVEEIALSHLLGGRPRDTTIDSNRLAQLRATVETQACHLDTLTRSNRFRCLQVQYHDVLEHPARESTRINDFLGGSVNEAVMASIPTATLYRSRI